tara:strand:+ start:2297 stop:3160 length:864 start_codon:yes stop_codon:yes gene_type:complete
VELVKYSEPAINNSLKDTLDSIDDVTKGAAFDGFYYSRANILLGMWEKGRVIASHFRGGKMRSWNLLAKETGRRDVSLKKWNDIYEHHPDRQEYIKVAMEKARSWTERALGDKKDTIAVKWTGDQESYTPEKYIESARAVMGSIDVDPASNDLANETVRATKYYTKEDDGLSKPWVGNVFLNPPYSQPEIKQFIDKLIDEAEQGNVSQAILLTNNNTDTTWFHDAAEASTLLCFTKGRINFNKPDGTKSQPTNGQAFFYFGKDMGRFANYFKQHGSITEVVQHGRFT